MPPSLKSKNINPKKIAIASKIKYRISTLINFILSELE
jgi:hypothetical protein